MSTYHRYRAWPPRRPCPTCGEVTAVRPNGLFRVHPIARGIPRCAGSGEIAPLVTDTDTLRGRRSAYVQLLLDLIERHGYKPDLCDRVERTMKAMRGNEADPHNEATSRPRLIVVCGSVSDQGRLADAALAARTIDHDLAYIPRARDGLTRAEHDREHRAWIDRADEVIAVRKPDGSVGESTASEVEYALSLGKPVRWWPPEATDD
jgi:hypothetical protein